MRVRNCNVTIELDRNEVWTLAFAMANKVKDSASHYIKYKGTYIKGFREDKGVACEVIMVRELYYSIGEVSCFRSFEYEIEQMFEKAKEDKEASDANPD